MTDSSMKNLGEVEYDKQNWLQHQKSQIRLLVVNCHQLNRLGVQGRAQAPFARRRRNFLRIMVEIV